MSSRGEYYVFGVMKMLMFVMFWGSCEDGSGRLGVCISVCECSSSSRCCRFFYVGICFY